MLILIFLTRTSQLRSGNILRIFGLLTERVTPRFKRLFLMRTSDIIYDEDLKLINYFKDILYEKKEILNIYFKDEKNLS